MRIFKTNLKIVLYFLIIFIGQISKASEKSQQTLVQVENFFKDLTTLEASFIQVSPSGDISNGKIYLDLPGKLRIDYEKPNNLLITSQGFWIVIQDRDSKTTNNIPVKSTPFSILLKDKSKLNNENFKIRAPGRNNHNAPKLIEKYNDLAREALSNGDKILSENYFQHAEHFIRVLEEKESHLNKSQSSKEITKTEEPKDQNQKTSNGSNSEVLKATTSTES